VSCACPDAGSRLLLPVHETDLPRPPHPARSGFFCNSSATTGRATSKWVQYQHGRRHAASDWSFTSCNTRSTPRRDHNLAGKPGWGPGGV